MGVRIIQGKLDGDSRGYAVLYCSTSMWAFGPVFEDEFQAQEFLDWLPDDPRGYNDALLESKYVEFLEEKEATEKAEAEEVEKSSALSGTD